MRVWRVEHKESLLGPYAHFSLPKDCLGYEPNKPPFPADLMAMVEEHDVSTLHLCPQEEGLKFKKGDLCGFASLDDLKLWFRGYLKALHRYGFVIQSYSVHTSGVRQGQHQIVISGRAKLRQVDQLSLLSSRRVDAYLP